MKSENKEDFFAKLVAGGKKMTGEVKRLQEILPLPVERKELDKSDLVTPLRKELSEEEQFANFIKEKEELKKHYLPFLEKHSRNISNYKTKLVNFKYRRETKEDELDFSLALSGKGNWQDVKIPHYIGETGKWNAYYFTSLNLNTNKNKEYILSFESVDYICDVYLNGRLLVKHTGFFAPFEANITKYGKNGINNLLIVVHNDLTTVGISVNGMVHHGNKIYACTNIGYDEPSLGWHHCPAGAGIIGKVFLIESSKQRITDCFVRPDINNGTISVETEITNYAYDKTELDIFYTIEGRNFIQPVIEAEKQDINTIQIDQNYIKKSLQIPNFKLWTLDTPYLYDLTIVIKDKQGNIIDEYQTHFGMRSFHMDLNSKPLKGAFYFNNKRIILRGTNEMGHLPRAIMEENYNQLIDDILIAKVAGLNFYRMTQRPTLSEVYDYFDMLGMLCQSDFPIFSYLTNKSLPEAYKQVDEMERLTRNHPSVVIESFSNEALDKTAWGKEQYVLSRYELEKFFDIARGIVELLNPDRVIKYVEGDYAPLENTYGISDFHCYTYWYISHALPSGKLRKGYLPPIRKDYMCGCGEFGVDGLDSYELMKKYAPKEWLPKNIDEPWSPKVISKAQCYSLHGDFFPEQENILSWIKASREFQAKAIKEYVHSLRIRTDYIESTAVHLLIDAWPMGWTKALVDVDRNPKPAYYAFKEANIPLRASLRRDKFVIYQNDYAPIEVLAFNDLLKDKKVTFNISNYYGDSVESYKGEGIANKLSSTYLGEIKVHSDTYLGPVKIAIEMLDENNQKTYDELEVIIKKINEKACKKPIILSKSLESIDKLCENNIDENILFVDTDYYKNHQEELEKNILEGKTIFLNMTRPMNVFGKNIMFKVHTLEEEVRANNLIFTNKNHKLTKEFNDYDFMNFFNEDKDYQDLTAWFKFYNEDMEEILYTLEDTNEEEYKLHKRHKIVMGEIKKGRGKLIISTLSSLQGCIGSNPVLDKLFINLINNN